MTNQWRPTSNIDTLKTRALLIRKIRQFFLERDVLEVDTPAMSHAAVTDIHLHTFCTEFVGQGHIHGIPLYMITSPEFHMKRLLAAGSGAIYQICKSFRNEEVGRYHNPEFMILEWYRPSFDHHALMTEIDSLLHTILGTSTADRMTYQGIFKRILGVCPLEASITDLKRVATTLGVLDIADNEEDRDTLIQLLFNEGVEAKIGRSVPAFVYDFPVSQAASARVCEGDSRVAARFEVYYQGVELANGFYELDNANEQLARFEKDNKRRVDIGRNIQPIDHHLIDAIHFGLSDCAGVALGIDRLIMLALGKTHINEVIAFPIERA
ncbi:elongation factor P--(R)-beta-lysine ligase [Candidatus Enterovibrio escicola]|uniref:Translation elongation factor P n=1 Tax=Candidatus Enterovibrio escicola TaxID=1927127 RepID=A0A2A5T6T8_9GAMM|nr:elongation factor P--(R)-beta-lysine ligase [Candidatus Enterovibrio escacola]PCS23810.1 Translation elongation factor P [Candidatus Enterovibrio escacola]